MCWIACITHPAEGDHPGVCDVESVGVVHARVPQLMVLKLRHLGTLCVTAQGGVWVRTVT
jgi:hypothetical protein